MFFPIRSKTTASAQAVVHRRRLAGSTERSPSTLLRRSGSWSTRHTLVNVIAGLLLVSTSAGNPMQDRVAAGGPVADYDSAFVHVDGARLHYLDFGGEGLPLLLTAAP